jgi:hypothetical protein
VLPVHVALTPRRSLAYTQTVIFPPSDPAMSSNPYHSPPAAGDSSATATEDPLLIHARREALVAFGLWLTAMLWTIGYCGMFGYGDQGGVKLVLGVPSWVMWGVFVPWGLCTVVSSLLATVFIQDADLGEDPEEKRGEHEAAREIGDA